MIFETKAARLVVKATSLVLLVASVWMVTAGRSARADEPVTIDTANRAFGEGRFSEAATQLEQLVRSEGFSAALLFDLGNARLREGKPALAIVAYERALLLAPRDPGIEANLALARADVGAPDDRGALVHAAGFFSTSAWTWLAAGGFWLMAGGLGAAAFSKRRRPLWTAVAASAAVTTATALGAIVVARSDLDRAIVLEPAPLRVSPFETAQSELSLSPGASVETGRTRDAYVFVRDRGGHSGWVEKAQVESIVPSAS